MNYFQKLDSIDVTKHIEKKNNFSYLSWTYALRELKKAYPDSYFVVEEYDGKPYLKTETGYFVKVTVTVEGISQSQIHPVVKPKKNYGMIPIENPTNFDINTSIQRCLTKAIALHGLGIHIYAGEDLPAEEAAHSPTLPPTQDFKIEQSISNKEVNKAVEIKSDNDSGVIACPRCEIGEIRLSANGKVFSCSDWKNGCKFSIWRNGDDLQIEDVKKMCDGEKTRPISLTKKDGSEYEARLDVSDGEVKYDYDCSMPELETTQTPF